MGTKLIVAEELGRLDTVGVDCVAMNVNDVICIGAEPLAMLDYIAIERANPEVCEQIGIDLGEDPDGVLGRSLGDALLEPTEIYVKPIVELLRSPAAVHGLAHITSGGTGNLLRLAAEVGYEIDDGEMHEVFNMGCGFCVVVPAADEAAALDLLSAHYPAAARIGRAVEGERAIHR